MACLMYLAQRRVCATERPGVSQTATGKLSNELSRIGCCVLGGRRAERNRQLLAGPRKRIIATASQQSSVERLGCGHLYAEVAFYGYL